MHIFEFTHSALFTFALIQIYEFHCLPRTTETYEKYNLSRIEEKNNPN